MHSLFFTQSLFLLSLSSSFSASEKSWHRLGLGDVLRPLITLCQLCYTLVGVHLSFPICFCSHYLAPGQAPCLKYTHTRTCAHAHAHKFYLCADDAVLQLCEAHTRHCRVFFVFFCFFFVFIFTSVVFLERTGEIKRKRRPPESRGC